MIPTRTQYRKWSLPTKWSFWAAVIGLPIGLGSLLLTIWPLTKSDPLIQERGQLLLKTAQETRHNHEWLSEVALTLSGRIDSMPPGSIKTDGLRQLLERHGEWLLRDSYGEEKYIHQLSLDLKEVSARLGTPNTRNKLLASLKSLDYTLDDIHFLNNFLLWYVSPHMRETLTEYQTYSLGWQGLPGTSYVTPGGAKPAMKQFLHDGKPIVDYLGAVRISVCEAVG